MERMKREKVVVTGAGGFIGYHLANALAADAHDVVGIDVRYPESDATCGTPEFEAIVGDFRDDRLMQRHLQGASVLYHLASAHLQQSLPESEYWSVNVHALPKLLKVAQDAGVRRCVHTSSTAVYGDTGSKSVNEDAPMKPQSIYGETKLAGEQDVLDYAQHHNFDVVVLRPAWVYGAGCPRTMKIIRTLRRRRFVMIGKGANLRHPVYIDDMIQAYRLAATSPDATHQVFNVAGEAVVSTRQLLAACSEVFDLPMPSLHIPYPVGAFVAVCVECLCAVIRCEPPISRRRLEFFNTNNAFDISRARDVLGYQPHYSLHDGLTRLRKLMQSKEGMPEADAPSHLSLSQPTAGDVSR